MTFDVPPAISPLTLWNTGHLPPPAVPECQYRRHLPAAPVHNPNLTQTLNPRQGTDILGQMSRYQLFETRQTPAVETSICPEKTDPACLNAKKIVESQRNRMEYL